MVVVDWVGKFVKARREEWVRMLFDRRTRVVEGEMDGIDDCEQPLKEDGMSRDAFGISTVDGNKDNLAKCADGEEMDAGGLETDVFFVFDLGRGNWVVEAFWPSLVCGEHARGELINGQNYHASSDVSTTYASWLALPAGRWFDRG